MAVSLKVSEIETYFKNHKKAKSIYRHVIPQINNVALKHTLQLFTCVKRFFDKWEHCRALFLMIISVGTNIINTLLYIRYKFIQ